MYVNAWVPDQQVAPIVDYFMKEKNAKTFFLIGSDYAFGRGMLEFTKGYIAKKGGKLAGEEYLPMDGSDWTPIINKLKSAKPDAIITSTAGGAPNVTLTKQLRAAGINLPYGNLAVDEGTAKEMGSPEHVASIIDTYKQIGFSVAIDDFGAGHSGLDMFARFVPDEIKLDMELIRDIDTNPRRRAIVRSMVSLCAELDTLLIAEGIETAAEAATLNDLGVRYHQGYWYARPALERLPRIHADALVGG